MNPPTHAGELPANPDAHDIRLSHRGHEYLVRGVRKYEHFVNGASLSTSNPFADLLLLPFAMLFYKWVESRDRWKMAVLQLDHPGPRPVRVVHREDVPPDVQVADCVQRLAKRVLAGEFDSSAN